VKVLIIVVNYRSAALTSDALQSLIPERERLPSCHVVVVDNDSGDDSISVLSQLIAKNAPLPDFVTLVRAERNGGFSYGNNVGLRHWLAEHETPDYVLLLNPDTIVRKDALPELVRFMDANPGVGIAGSRLEDPDGTPQRSAFRFPTVASEFEGAVQFGPVSRLLSRWVVAPPVSNDAHPTDWVAGASMIIRWKMIHELGMLDEAYFMYFEEVDYCLRAKRAGWPCWYVPTSHVVHLVGQVSQVTDPNKSRQRRPQYWFESRRRYFLKNHGPAILVSADVACLVGTTLRRLRLFLERKPDNTPLHFIADFIRHGVFFKGFETVNKDLHFLSLLQTIREDWQAHNRDWTKPGFQAMAVHRFGNWRMTVQPKLARAPLSMMYRAMFRFVRNFYGIELPYSATIGRRVVIEHQGDIVVHGNAVLGDECILRQGVTIGNRRMDRPLEAPNLGKGVNVGAGAKILGAVTIGDCANVGANAVVTSDVAAHTTVVGIPARPIQSTHAESKS
jgi:N-acetylglucosaminyl-diphospho-decaprenol L-rhamnosyltransferase